MLTIKKLRNKFKKLDNIQLKAECIILEEQDEATKQQQLMNLAKENGIPIDSSDVYCRRLSYVEMFNRINVWIKDRRSARYTRINVYSACISASTAMLAVIVSLFIHWQTRQLLVPTERPIICAIDSKCIGNINNDANNIEITLNLVIKNIGKHPAENIKITVWGAPLDEPNSLKICRDFILADSFFPDTQATLSNKIAIQLKSFNELKGQRKKVFLYIKMDYADAFILKQKYTQGFHLSYEIGKGVVSGATLEEKDIFESSLKKVGAI